MREGNPGDTVRNPVCIVGGGVIGLAIGWRLSRKGAAVAVFDRNTAGRGASWVAAGMLAPLSEVGFEDEGFLSLGQESLRLYPRFLEELKEDAQVEMGFRQLRLQFDRFVETDPGFIELQLFDHD